VSQVARRLTVTVGKARQKNLLGFSTVCAHRAATLERSRHEWLIY